MRTIFILGIMLTATTAMADVPTLQYVLEYYEKQCGNPYLTAADIKQYVYPDRNGAEIATQWIALNAIDSYINYAPQTTYASELSKNNVISTGYLEDTLSLIQVPDCCIGGIYNDRYGECEYCDISTYTAKDAPCPAGWERVELSHAAIGIGEITNEQYGWTDPYCPTGTSQYSETNDACANQIVTATAPASAPFDVCIPPVNGEIVTNPEFGAWAIGDNCTITDNGPTCDITRIEGNSGCYDDICYCYAQYLISPTGELIERRGPRVYLKRYNTIENCDANCAHDCAVTVQTMTGFRRALLSSPESPCEG